MVVGQHFHFIQNHLRFIQLIRTKDKIERKTDLFLEINCFMDDFKSGQFFIGGDQYNIIFPKTMKR